MPDKEHTEKKTSCAYFVERKRRFCRMAPISSDQKFCCQHMPVSSMTDDDDGSVVGCTARQRMLCPLDSKHSCYKDQLAKHLKRCNFREKTRPPFYERNINSGSEMDDSWETNVPVSNISDATLQHLLEKLEVAYNKHVKHLSDNIRACDLVEEELSNNPDYGQSASKHLKQNSSIIGILKERGFFENGPCFIEFGAGRGQLSYWLIQALDSTPESSFVLIDRASQRHKFDNRDKVKDRLKITRLKIDIEHLNLAKVPQVSNSKNIIAISKHLCGAATDSALHCLVNYNRSMLERKSQNPNSIKGLFFALCCHHRCSWKHYFGRKHFESWGFNREDFGILQSISSWATCGWKEMPNTDTVSNSEDINYRFQRLNLSVQKRMEFGIKSKLLIDEGRARSLLDNGFAAELFTYVSKDVTLENVGLLAYNPTEFPLTMQLKIP